MSQEHLLAYFLASSSLNFDITSFGFSCLALAFNFSALALSFSLEMANFSFNLLGIFQVFDQIFASLAELFQHLISGTDKKLSNAIFYRGQMCVVTNQLLTKVKYYNKMVNVQMLTVNRSSSVSLTLLPLTVASWTLLVVVVSGSIVVICLHI